MTDVDMARLAGHRGRLVARARGRPGHRRGDPRRDGDHLLRDGRPTCRRTATTPILNQRNERNATILDAQGRLAALSVGHPAVHAHVARCRCASRSTSSASTSSARATCSSANDPYHGGGHLPDYNVFAPVFADDPTDGERRMVLIATIQCHHGDTGGGVPGGYNVTAGDIWGEGVRWPVVKVIDRGVERRDVLYALQANNRIPDYIGDLRAQIGAAQLAARAPRRADRPLRRADRRGIGRLHDRLRGATLPRGGRRPGPTASTRPTPTSTTTRSATPTSTCT